jgi:hypothetical protein
MQATNGSKQHEAESEMQNSKLSEADMLIYDKAKKNIFSAGTLQGKEAESDRMRDIVLMLPGAREPRKECCKQCLTGRIRFASELSKSHSIQQQRSVLIYRLIRKCN